MAPCVEEEEAVGELQEAEVASAPVVEAGLEAEVSPGVEASLLEVEVVQEGALPVGVDDSRPLYILSYVLRRFGFLYGVIIIATKGRLLGCTLKELSFQNFHGVL